MSTATTELLAEAVEQLVTVVARQPRLPGDDEPGELSTFQAITLAVLADDGGQRLGSLALALGTTDATASRTVDVLEALGLVTRRPDDLDRRCIVVAATDEGLELVRERRKRLEKLVDSLVAGLSAEDGARLAVLLAELGELLRPSL
jgi:DNA-binding MarR family transcriptional regulator